MLLGGVLVAEELNPKDVEFFEKKIRPVLVKHCYSCHAADAKKIQGGLLLDTRAGIRQGGDSGAAVEPGSLDESLLLEAIRYESFEMPPKGRLPEEVIADFERWIQRGAPDPRDGPVRRVRTDIDLEKGRSFWAFQPLRKTRVPQVGQAHWAESDIDRHILAVLEAKGLLPVHDADRTTLIRRVYFALIGLPPSLHEIDQFVQDPAPTKMALAKVVDRLLESKQFGERWGRHWLDVVRFAESSGGGRTLLFPQAWRYRDYVIQALNHDLPYDLFLKEQLAGDLMPAADWSEQRRQTTATAFLLLGPTNYELQDKEVLEMDIVDEQLDTIGKAFLGMTIGCARCHDHKFDPIPSTDYYAMAGILNSTKSVVHANVSAWHEAELAVPPAEDEIIRREESVIAALRSDLDVLKESLKQAGGPLPSGAKSIDPQTLPGIVVDDSQAHRQGTWTASTSVAGYVGDSYLHDDNRRDEVKRVTFCPELPGPGKYEVRLAYTPGKNRSSQVPIEVHHVGGQAVIDVDQTRKGAVADTIESLGVFEFDPQGDPCVVVSNAGAADGVVVADAAIFVPLDQLAPKIASPDSPADPAEAEEANQTKKRRRADLARKIKSLEKRIKDADAKRPKRPMAMAVTDKEEVGDMPLAIRGAVHNKGRVVPRGVLRVAMQGPFPAIPEGDSGRLQLADWIVSPDNPLTARVMVNRVWYWLFGQGIVRTVDNFGSTGDAPSHPELLDQLALEFIENDWSVKKLIRNIMLSRVYRLSTADNRAALEVDPTNRLLWRMNRRRLDAESIRDTLLYVSGRLDLKIGGANIKEGTKIEYGYRFDSPRRSVYLPVFRNTLPQIFATFDFADPNIQGGKRTSSTIAPQALLLMNHPMVIEQAEAAATRLLEQRELDLDSRIRHAYRQVLGRFPSPREAELVRDFVRSGRDAHRWGLLYQMLFQSLDFRYVN